MTIAKKIGSHDISIRKAGGCQAVPRYPSIHGRLDEVVRMENEQLDFDELVKYEIDNSKQVPIE